MCEMTWNESLAKPLSEKELLFPRTECLDYLDDYVNFL